MFVAWKGKKGEKPVATSGKKITFRTARAGPRADDFIAMDDHGRAYAPFPAMQDHKWIPHRDNDMKNELERR